MFRAPAVAEVGFDAHRSSMWRLNFWNAFGWVKSLPLSADHTGGEYIDRLPALAFLSLCACLTLLLPGDLVSA